MHYDVAVIGAGVIGGMLARELSRYRLSVCILERENDVAMGASRANSGIIHGGFDPVPGTLKAKLNAAGVEPLFQVAQALHVPCRRNGSMVCAFSADEESTLQALYARGLANGTTGMQLLSGEEARQLEPHLSSAVTRVLQIKSAGIICPYELTIAAIGNAMDNGVALKRNFQVNRIQKDGPLFTVTAQSGDAVRCSYLVNCAGGHSGSVAALAGDTHITILPRAGEYLLLDKREGTRTSHTLFRCPSKDGKGILVTPTVDGNLLTGPTAVPVATPEFRDTTPDGLAAIQSLASQTVPSVDFRQTITSFAGVRASTPGGDFLLEPSRHLPGFIHAAAVDSPGLSCCVSIARYLIDLLAKAGLTLEEKTDWDGTREDPHAFRHMSISEKDSYIHQHPSFGKVVCRCECVSEGEIVAAIHRNPPALDVDGVKRRTRSGMGRCQGGFCAPHIMELLARENHLPMETITKSGGNSYLVTERIGDRQ